MAYKRKRYRYKLRYKLIFWSLILMIIFSIALVFMNQPSTGTVIKHSLEDSPNQADQRRTNTITGKHFSLTYDATLDTVSNISQGDSTALEVYRIARSDIKGRRIFVMTIKQLPSGGMSEESSYKLRRTNPTVYREGAMTIGDLAFVTFQKSDNTELTGFVVQGDKLAMLAYTLQAPDGELETEARDLFDDFRWQ